MSSGSAPAPPKDYFKQTMPQAVGNSFSGINSFSQMPNYGQQTYNQAQGTFAGTQGPSGWDPTQAVNAGNSMISGSQALSPYVAQLFQMGFDPQNDFYNQSAHNLTEQTNAELSKRGIATSPYGAGVTGQVLGQFNNDWQNQRLGRAVQGAGAGGQLQGQINQGTQQGAQLGAQAPQWQAQIAQMMAALGNNSYAFPQQTIQDWLQYSGLGAQSGQQRYQDQFQNWQQQNANDASMWGGLGNLAGSAVGAFGIL